MLRLIEADFQSEYGIDLTSREARGKSWRRFCDLLAGLMRKPPINYISDGQRLHAIYGTRIQASFADWPPK